MEPLIKDCAAEKLRATIVQKKRDLVQFTKSASKCRKHRNFRQAALFDRRRRELAAALKALLVRLDKLPAGTEKLEQEATNEHTS